MGKAEDKRAAIVAQQAARELEERRARGADPRPAKRRTNWAASPPMPGSRRGRPPKPPE